VSATGQYSDVEYVFEPHSGTAPKLGPYLAALWERRPFMVELARADLRSLRSATVLGHLWSVLDPLFQAGLYYFLYRVMRAGSADQSRFLPVLIGDVFLFGLTTAAIGEAGKSIKRARGLMLGSTFPRALLPVTSIYKSLRGFAPSACVFAVLFILLFSLQLVMNLGIALLVSTFITIVADATNVMTYITRILFFASPVIYPVALLPDVARQLVSWQPLFPLFASYQAVLSGEVPSPVLVLQTAFWAVALLVIGSRIFLRHERAFAMHL
jgi:teichoic acid transport system permease protein